MQKCKAIHKLSEIIETISKNEPCKKQTEDTDS